MTALGYEKVKQIYSFQQSETSLTPKIKIILLP